MMLRLSLSPFSVSFFHHVVVFLLFTHTCGGQYQLTGPPQPIVALVGDDITLLRHTEPAVDASDLTVEWTRPDLNPRFVHVWRDGGELEGKKHPSYRGRTSLFVNNLKHGDVSLKLNKVKLSDEGRYRCFLPGLNQASVVQLVVGVVSSPVVEINNSIRVLHCKSEGWYPEPEVSWLDSEGHVLSAGPTETVRGPDGLYTVSSRVTVEKRHNNNFTCRVQQKNINQIRETQIHVPDDFFELQSSSASVVTLTVGLSVCILLIVAAVFVLWKKKQKKHKTKTGHEDDKLDEEEKKNKSTSDDPERQSLMGGGRNSETTAMNRDKGGEKKILSLSCNAESLTAVKNTEERTQKSSQDTNKIYTGNQREVKEKKGQRSEEENLVQSRTNEKQTEINLQTETSEKQDGGERQLSEGKSRVKTGIDKFQNCSREEKLKIQDAKLVNDTKMLADKKLVSTNLEKFSGQRGESEDKPQTESQRTEEERKRNTDQSTLTVAHGHIMRF